MEHCQSARERLPMPLLHSELAKLLALLSRTRLQTPARAALDQI